MDRVIHLLVIAGLLLATVLMTWPVAANMSTHVAGDGGDSLKTIWDMWWTEKAAHSNHSIYVTDYLFHPHGTSRVAHLPLAPLLAYNGVTGVNNLLGGVPGLLMPDGYVFFYNLLLLLSFVASGYAMFLFIRYLVDRPGIAALAGFAYAFTPYRMAHAIGHLNLAATEWLPLFLLFYLKMLRHKQYRYAIAAAVFLVIQALVSLQYFIVAVTIGGILLLHENWVRDQWRDASLWRRLLVFGTVVIVFLLPFVHPLLVEMISADYISASSMSSYLSPGSYIVPSPIHTVWGDFLSIFYPQNKADSVAFLGFTVIGGAAVFVRRHWREGLPWIAVAAVCGFFSVFPGIVESNIAPLFPLLDGLNNTGRFALGVVVAATVLFSLSLDKYLSTLADRLRCREAAVLALLLVIIAFEFLSVPFPTTPVRPVPDAVEDIGESRHHTVLNIPTSLNSHALYWQTVHEKRIIGGYVSRTPTGALETISRLKNASREGDSETVRYILSQLDVGHIIEFKYRPVREETDLSRVPELVGTETVYSSRFVEIHNITDGGTARPSR